MNFTPSSLFRRPIESSIRQRDGGIQIRTVVRELPGIVVLSGCLLLFVLVGLSALRGGSSGGWVAFAFAAVVAYPLFRRLGGGGDIIVTGKGVAQRIHYKTRCADWAAIDGVNFDPSGRVDVRMLDGDQAGFVTLGLPAVTWERNLYAWRDDPTLLDLGRLGIEVDRLRHEARTLDPAHR
ncbi:hypothetical protein [Nostocoides sp. Soil756]|jgi:hypothetical protein|uniref:hypothetical protein n=1 Tax=Nostocoides sp. Soil756 TaxID=1736399 RepID=UPI0009E70CA3|nr:hypothetical protein [Tetrasphaera sp. Soil756]